MDIGFIANPASGKDIRRLTAGASVFDNQEKSAIVRRCLAGIAGVEPNACIHYFPDTHQITHAAVNASNLVGKAIDMRPSGTAIDSTCAARKLGFVDVMISLGGDGTNRAIAKGLNDIPLVALSTGTNNAFPSLFEATIAGMAAATVAKHQLPISEIAPRTKAIHIESKSGLRDLALVDLVGTRDRFTGTRELMNPNQFVFAVVSVADPSKVGITGIAGMHQLIEDVDDFGLVMEFGVENESCEASLVNGAIAPGVVQPIAKSRTSKISMGETRQFKAATMLALDGEREIPLSDEEELYVTIARDGPCRVDIARTMRLINS